MSGGGWTVGREDLHRAGPSRWKVLSVSTASLWRTGSGARGPLEVLEWISRGLLGHFGVSLRNSRHPLKPLRTCQGIWEKFRRTFRWLWLFKVIFEEEDQVFLHWDLWVRKKFYVGFWNPGRIHKFLWILQWFQASLDTCLSLVWFQGSSKMSRRSLGGTSWVLTRVQRSFWVFQGYLKSSIAGLMSLGVAVITEGVSVVFTWVLWSFRSFWGQWKGFGYLSRSCRGLEGSRNP